MIDFKKLYPSVYYDKSRDFQLIGRTYEIVFNYLKTGVDTIKHDPLTTDSDEQLLDLMSYTLGFKPKHKYNTTQLVAICSALMLIMKNKGSIKSIEYALAALLKAEGITDEGTIHVDYSKNILTIYCPSQLSDIVLLNDLLDYILPAGLSYNITRQSQTTTAYEEYPVTSSDYTISAVQMNTDVSIAPTYEITSTMVPADTGEGRIDNSSVVA
jgi:hypothetical protein